MESGAKHVKGNMRFPLKCNDCSRTFWMWEQFKAHRERDHLCPPDFRHNYKPYMDEIKQHAAVFLQEKPRPSKESGPLKCRFCQRTFETKDQLLDHID